MHLIFTSIISISNEPMNSLVNRAHKTGSAFVIYLLPSNIENKSQKYPFFRVKLYFRNNKMYNKTTRRLIIRTTLSLTLTVIFHKAVLP